MTNEFKRTPTHGENDVDLRVATEPRRVTDAVLSQIIATKNGEIAALTAEVTHLAEKLAERAAKAGSAAPQVKLWDSQWVNIVNHADCYEGMSKEDAVHLAVKLTEERIKANYAKDLAAAPQPVDAVQATTGPWKVWNTNSVINETEGQVCVCETAEDADLIVRLRNAAPPPAAQPAAQGVVQVAVGYVRRESAAHLAEYVAEGLNNSIRLYGLPDPERGITMPVYAPIAQPTDTPKGA